MNDTLYPIIPASEVQVSPDAPILKALEIINNTDAHIALVVDSKGCLIGSLVDGDIRRALLAGCTLNSPVHKAMHRNPASMQLSSVRRAVLDAMRDASVKQMPLLNADGSLVGIAVYDALSGFLAPPKPNAVVIMAGGKGKRLMPLTQDIPKPMVEVGGKPMLEHIIVRFIRQGFTEFYFCVNHLSHVIEHYFGNGENWKCTIHYVHEDAPLGTAGALSLLAEPFAEPFIVINGDILTNVEFSDVLDYHISNDSFATICARTHRIEVPYGVLQIEDGMMQAIVEKPVYEDMISAGIYVFAPNALQYLKKAEAIDMPLLLQNLVKAQRKVAVFPMHENWTDIGRHDDLDMAKRALSVAG